jgi:inhibitor of KinA sporulation pathway (predicted exonuclease)
MKRLYLDTEYCYPGMLRGTPRPTAADKRQFVQIAAIVVEVETGRISAKFDQLVTPEYEKTVPEFFTELTGITQSGIDASAISFSEAFRDFTDFANDVPILTFDKDEEVLRQNCQYVSLPWPFTRKFIRVKPLLPQWGIDPDMYSSGTLYKAAGLSMDGHVHNALHDVESMSLALYVLENGRQNPDEPPQPPVDL